MIPLHIAALMLMGGLGATTDDSDPWGPMGPVPRPPDPRPVAPIPVYDDTRRIAAAQATRERRANRNRKVSP